MDIPLLVASFLEKYATGESPTQEISEEAMRTLMAYGYRTLCQLCLPCPQRMNRLLWKVSENCCAMN